MKVLGTELIDDWKRWYTFYSIHAALVAIALGAAEVFFATLPWTPAWLIGILTVVAGISGIVGRMVKQDPKDAAIITHFTSGGTKDGA